MRLGTPERNAAWPPGFRGSHLRRAPATAPAPRLETLIRHPLGNRGGIPWNIVRYRIYVKEIQPPHEIVIKVLEVACAGATFICCAA